MLPELLVQKAKQKGTSDEYFKWLSYMPSAVSGLYGAYIDGEGRNEGAHHRAVENGSGVGIKPDFSGCPLTSEEHALQHQKGASVFAPKEWWDNQAAKHLAMWINGVKPPIQESKSERTFIIEHAGQFLALWLWAKKYFQASNKPIKITVKRNLSKRSYSQNAGLWAAVNADLVEYYTKNPTDFGRDLCKAVLKQGIDQDSVHYLHKLLQGCKSTAKLNTEQFGKYFDNVAEYMKDNHKHTVKMPVNHDDII